MTYVVYIAGFLVASALIAGSSCLVWRAVLRSMPNPPHWMDAFELVWCDVYLMEWKDRPRVVFVWGESFEHCGAQVAGLSEFNGAITVAVAGKTTKISDTAFAHELRHQARRLLGFGPDPGHKDADWAIAGIVERANQKLRQNGW